MNKLEIIELLDQHALENYEFSGWDFWVETYDLKEKLETIGNARTFAGAKKKVLAEIEPLAEIRAEIQSTAF